MRRAWDLVICDLDGTLVDSTPSVVAAMVSTLDQLGIAPPAGFDLSSCAGPPLHESLAHLLGANDRLEEAIVAYRLHYRTEAWRLTRSMAGVEQALSAWSESKIELAVCTYTPAPVAVDILKQTGSARYFALVVGTDLRTDDRRVKADLLEETLRRCRRNKKGTLYIGDHELDAAAAARAGVSFSRAGASGWPWPVLATKVMTGRGVARERAGQTN